MFGALIIVFREVIEAGLIIGIVLAATRGIGGRGHWVAAGVLLGTLGAGIVALFAEAIASAFEGSGQELLTASVLGAAVVMLMWHTVWMARHGGAEHAGIEQFLARAFERVGDGLGKQGDDAGAERTEEHAGCNPVSAAADAAGRGQHDADDQTGFDHLAEDDDERAEHVAIPRLRRLWRCPRGSRR